jgi:Fe-S oxidoreductase
MAKCHICGGKEDVVMAECSTCRQMFADQKTDQEIEDIWETVGKNLELLYTKEDFENWS